MNMHKLSLTIRSITAIFWMGFFIAISFMEAPLKFSAPDLSMAEGLRIGKIIFKALNTCEWVFLLIIFITCIGKKITRKSLYLVIAISMIMVLETAWLLPILDRDADLIIRGHPVSGHSAHWLYVLLEVIKVPVLLLLGLDSIKALREDQKN